MHFKLLITLVEDSKTNAIMTAAREAGATGATVLSQARGEGLKQTKTFFGLNLESQRDMLLFLVEEHLSRDILDTKPGTGIAFQIDVEDAVGVSQQISQLTDVVEDKL
jgi:hypothetical protein